MSRAPGSGGLVVPGPMQRLLDRPGRLTVAQGGQTLRELYRKNSITFNPSLLSEFAQACFAGALDAVKAAIEKGSAPDIVDGHETAYKYGYALLVLFGAQRLQLGPGDKLDHLGTLKYLLEQGASPDVPDVLGYTALHHACMAYPRADIARILLEHGANPDAQDRFGDVPLMGAFQNNSVGAIDVLMEFGASLDVADADGFTPGGFYVKCGPQVTAVIDKWKRKRAGEARPLDDKACAVCKKGDGPLKYCSRCHTTWYCSKECQDQDWRTHKRVCAPLGAEGTVTVKPFYSDQYTSLEPVADMARMTLGIPTQTPSASQTRAMKKSRIPPGQTKKMIVKIQVPPPRPADAPPEQRSGELLVYDRKRSFVCRIREEDGPAAYTQIAHAARTKGVVDEGRAKAYFSAEMTSPDALVVKVSEVLPEQPF